MDVIALFVPVESEIYLSQALSGCSSDGIPFSTKLDDLGVLDESLSPDFNQSLLER
jgi:hypothetical protein